MNVEDMLARRARLFGPGNPLFYENPLHLVRGEGAWVYDADGRKYLDCYNNVPCTGHCHPRVVEAICQQAKRLNTHTRYLHETILRYGETLLAKFEPSLERLMLACTGSEANEIAMRMARFNSGGTGYICTNATYHGNTALVSQLSSIFEPFEGYGENIRQVPWPDSYRALDGLEGEALADAYALKVEEAIASLHDAGIKLAAFLVCPIFANEGLPNIPPGFMDKAVASVRAAGGLYIADEVQAGFGRTGKWWGHEHSAVVPDILTLGKPMAAGHPVSGVVARADLLDAYREQVMYFNTFGGNPVSSAAALAVIDVIEEEGLVENADKVGAYVLSGLQNLQSKHELIGDVRGKGLFFGIDLVTNRETKEPAVQETKRLVNSMRDSGVLLSNIGEHDNVLKIRPPLVFSVENADLLLSTLDRALEAI